ncbi:bifunctional metallophosphatase/5'-nucleotidase [Paenibacillus sp. PL2-23]|uniref:bifunctional metallophosphatase/5'-nucleotidase n=1 Tax=Paenibacillus sp. PL2-23 TaxID=2100729 RepID=UPI0030FB4902
MSHTLQHTEIILLHSNDIHSRLENAARISTMIAEERRVWGAHRVLAVDCGDHMDRMRMESEGTGGRVNRDLLQEAGYEAITLGNNEGLTCSADMLEQLYGTTSKLSVVCANMKISSTGARPAWMRPHILIEKNGLKVGLVGATANFAEFYALLGWTTTEPLAAIREQVSAIRGQCDILIVMSHLGITLDRQMAEEIDGIDLIVGGHTHHLLEEPLVIGTTTVCAAGKFGDYLGRVEIGWDADTSRPSFRATCVPTGAFPERAEADAVIRAHNEAARGTLSRVITRLKEPLPARTDAESPLANLLARGLRRWTDAEIGLVNTGQLLGGLAGGEVTAGELHALCPSPINPSRIVIAGRHIRLALEQALLAHYVTKPIKGFGFRGEVLGTLAMDGMTVRYDHSREPMGRIVSVLANGEPLQDERLYVVGTIDMFSFRVGYESLADTESCRFYLPEFIRDVIGSELLREDAIAACRVQNWIPQST